ncbi:MAG: hypothetical protein HF314_00485 [Ignavibacteria bacterium]|jgi:hypothetical protein|nr:hypothetical protein [Ignavibacteria bacterium]MCU7501528.1 hypothetical protein [Ignavibacteria bacterium]MCU7515956.1 hypothetical protein [Ignavibacteria bacterium]
MQNLNKISKIFLYVCSLSGILWFGGYLSRLLLTYQLFEPRDFILKNYVNDQNLGGIFYTLNSSVTFTLILYVVFLVSFVLFLSTSRIKLKEEGWLFVILLIVVITAPFELYLMSLDYQIANKVFYSSFVPKEILAIYIKRMKLLSSFPLIEIFSYCAILFLIIFKPLRMKKIK